MSIAPLGREARLLYSARETERILGVSHPTLYRIIGRKQLDARKIGRSTFITAQSIEEFLNGLPHAEVRGPEPVTNPWSPATGRGRGRPRKAAPPATPPTG
jgi:predicted DNA-binding transcriptional regulator AlpA